MASSVKFLTKQAKNKFPLILVFFFGKQNLGFLKQNNQLFFWENFMITR